MKENQIISLINRQLQSKGRYVVNVHGSIFSRNGTPDFITLDKDGQLVGIEAKVPGKQPVVNQWRHGIRLLKSGGRFIVAYDDFDVNRMDTRSLPTVEVGREEGESEFEAHETLHLQGTTEILLKNK